MRSGPRITFEITTPSPTGRKVGLTLRPGVVLTTGEIGWLVAKAENASNVSLSAAFKLASRVVALGPNDSRPPELKQAIARFLPGIAIDGIPGEVIGNWLASALFVQHFRSQSPELDPSLRQAWAEVTHDLELSLRDSLLKALTHEQAIDLLTQNAIYLRIRRHLPDDPSLKAKVVRDFLRVQTNREKGGKAAGKRYTKHWEQIEKAVLEASSSGKPSSRRVSGIVAGCIASPNFQVDEHNKRLVNEAKALAEISRWMKRLIPAKSGTGVSYTYGDAVPAAKRGK